MTQPLFIIPHWTNDIEESGPIFTKTIESLVNQTDQDFKILIVDDSSPHPDARGYLEALQERLTAEKLDIIHCPDNMGPGQARNAGIDYAVANGHPFIMFNDSDDCSDENRVAAVRKAFDEDDEVDVVYNNFLVVDERDRVVPIENIPESIVEIIRANNFAPPQGDEMWLKMGLYYGYTNLTSATSVRTHLAAQCKYPQKCVSEDYHTFLRYGAFGHKFLFLKDIMTKYRITQDHKGSSSSRDRVQDFYLEKVRTDNHGFLLALKQAMTKDDQIDPFDIMKRFNMRSCVTMLMENRIDLANKLLARANRYDRICTARREMSESPTTV